MHPFNTCPQCNVTLQAFYLPTADEAQLLEIDGCRRCGGLWFDAGEIEKVVTKKLELQWVEGKSYRLCARCRQPMTPWKTKGGVALEQCKSCRGTFLDAGELAQLGARQADAQARRAMTPPGQFECMKCQGKFPLSEGNAMGYGLVCRGCVVNPSKETPLDRFIPDNVQMTRDEEARYGAGGGATIFGGLLLLLDIFL